jgi:hypothetical protein
MEREYSLPFLPIPIQSQINSVHTFPLYFSKMSRSS